MNDHRQITVTGRPIGKQEPLIECSLCKAAVPQGAFSAHVDWHGTVLMAPQQS